MKIQETLQYLSLAAFGIGTLVLGGSQPASAVAASTCTWNGGTDTKFSTAANWSCDTGTLPVASSAIVIDVKNGASTPLSLVNDLGLSFDSLSVANTGTAYGSASIDVLSLTDGGTYIGSLSTSPGGSVNVATLTASNMTLLSGYLTTANISGTLTVATNAYLSLNPAKAALINAVVVQKGASLTLESSTAGDNTFPLNITFGGGTSTSAPTLSANGYSTYANKVWTNQTTKDIVSGNVVLNTDVTLMVNNKLTTLSVTKATTGTGKFVYNPYSQGPLVVAGVELPYVTKSTQLACDSSSYNSFAVARNETATLSDTSACQYGYVNIDGVLMGNGSVVHATGNTWGGYLSIAEGGVVAPGNSPGCITSDNLEILGTYRFEVGGTDPCTGYDQLIVTSFYDSQSAPYETITLGDKSVLEASVYGDFTPVKGQKYTIINNQSKWPVKGTFSSLPEGTNFNAAGVVYQISYIGGDGNDVVLTVIDAPLVPNTGIAISKANPAIIAAVAIVFAGVLAVAGRLAVARR